MFALMAIVTVLRLVFTTNKNITSGGTYIVHWRRAYRCRLLLIATLIRPSPVVMLILLRPAEGPGT